MQHTGMSFDACMQAHTNRQYRTYLAWKEEQWNIPTRDNHYQMGTTQAVRQVLAKRPNEIKMGHFRLKFGFTRKKSVPTEEDQKQSAAVARSVWAGLVGLVKGKPKGITYERKSDGRWN